MHTCINCNKRQAQRVKDTFTCEACGYTWDVAHEQANEAYLRTQGRRPASEQDNLESLDAELGLTDAGVTNVTPEDETHDTVEPDIEGAASLTVINGADGADIEIELDALDRALIALTVKEIDALAEKHSVDLAEARKKEDKIAALLAANVLTVVWDAEAGTVMGVE